MAFSLSKLIAGDLGLAWFNKFNANCDAQVAQEAARDAQIAALQAQAAVLAQAVGGVAPGAYSAPTDATVFTYSAATAPWTKAKSLGVATFGPVYNGAAPTTGGPSLTVMPWSMSQKSMLVGWLSSTASASQALGSLMQSAYLRRIALDASGAPSVSSPDTPLPYSVVSGQNVPCLAPIVAGVAISDTQYKGISFDYVYGGATGYMDVRRYVANWDGTNVNIANEGYFSSGTANGTGTSISFGYSANPAMLLNGATGMLNAGLLNYDINQFDRGANTDTSFYGYRITQGFNPGTHDFGGAGRVVVPYLTSTHADPTFRLTVSAETRDDVSGVVQSASFRVAGKTIGSTAPSIFCFSNTLHVVQWVDGNSVRWSVALVYNPATGILSQYGGQYYSAGNLANYPLQWMTMYSATVGYALRKDPSLPLAARFMRVTFDTSQPAGAELQSATATDIAFAVCATVANATAVTILGLVRMPGDIVVVYGRVAVTVSGTTTYQGFVESFQMS